MHPERTIKFKAKSIEPSFNSGGWVYGYFFKGGDDNASYIKPEVSTMGPTFYLVDPKTVCQFTDKHDKNGREIYENDRVKRIAKIYDFDAEEEKDEITFQTQESHVVYRNHGFWIEAEDFGYEGENLWHWDDIEVVGNLHD